MRHELNTRSQQHIAKCSTVDSRRKASRKPWPEICRKEWTNCFVPRSKKCEERHHTASSQWAEFTPTTAKLISINGSFAGAEPIPAQTGRNSKPASPNNSSHQSKPREAVGEVVFETAPDRPARRPAAKPETKLHIPGPCPSAPRSPRKSLEPPLASKSSGSHRYPRGRLVIFRGPRSRVFTAAVRIAPKRAESAAGEKKLAHVTAKRMRRLVSRRTASANALRLRTIVCSSPVTG
jgi:hypothetical protein